MVTDNRTRQRIVLDGLIRARGLHCYSLFFVTTEGKDLPGDLEEMSGYVIDETGQVYSFWMDWNDERGEPELTEWAPVEPDADWAEDPEYCRACEVVAIAEDGLSR